MGLAAEITRIRIEVEMDGEVVIEVEVINIKPVAEMEEVTEVRIAISPTAEAQEPPLITSRCVHSCQNQADASKVQENAHTFTHQATSPTSKFREEVSKAICLQTTWEEILECQILN